MRILRAADYKRMPWKNGKGETVELAVFPPDASVNDFDWRISMAAVTEDGPFSVFDGIDRTLSVLTGEGIELSVEGREPATLRQSSAPHFFAADAATSATLLSGAITDLNVMTRRGRFGHKVERLGMTDKVRIEAGETLTIVIAADSVEAGDTELGPLDAVLLEASEAIELSAGHAAVAYVIRLVRG